MFKDKLKELREIKGVCQNVLNQYNIVDYDAGFGLINYTKVGFRLKNTDTNSTTSYYGRSNVSYLEFKNQSASSSYILEVYVVDNKNDTTIKRVAISYDLQYIPLYICTVCGYQTTRPPMGI